MKWDGSGPARVPSMVLVLAVVLAMAGAATAQHLGLVDLASGQGEVHTQESSDEPTDDPCPEEGDGPENETDGFETSSEEGPEEGEQGCPEGGNPEGDDLLDDPEGLAAREAACLEAAGMSEGGEGEGDGVTGLDRAIEAVLANCMKSLEAPGLLVALEKLAANKARQEERAEARAAKRAAKAEAAGKDKAEVTGSGAGGGKSSSGEPKGKGKGRAKGGPPSG